ncbi:hypothetical protein C8J56DRAFT_893643 [Mycena floridula]|nr:hypothetical protein C8J56DRAFT_893643 [Mycena floridula]
MSTKNLFMGSFILSAVSPHLYTVPMANESRDSGASSRIQPEQTLNQSKGRGATWPGAECEKTYARLGCFIEFKMQGDKPTKDQLYHQRHRAARLATSRQYYANVVKPHRHQSKQPSDVEEESQYTFYTSADVAAELTDLESDLTGIVSDDNVRAHHAVGIVLRRRLRRVFKGSRLENDAGQLQALYCQAFDLNTDLVQGLLALSWFSTDPVSLSVNTRGRRPPKISAEPIRLSGEFQASLFGQLNQEQERDGERIQ